MNVSIGSINLPTFVSYFQLRCDSSFGLFSFQFDFQSTFAIASMDALVYLVHRPTKCVIVAALLINNLIILLYNRLGVRAGDYVHLEFCTLYCVTTQYVSFSLLSLFVSLNNPFSSFHEFKLNLSFDLGFRIHHGMFSK